MLIDYIVDVFVRERLAQRFAGSIGQARPFRLQSMSFPSESGVFPRLLGFAGELHGVVRHNDSRQHARGPDMNRRAQVDRVVE